MTESWLPSVDGVVTRLRATVAELHRAGHEVLVIAPREPGMHIDTATVRDVPTIGFRFLYGGKRWGLPFPRVYRYLREFDPDIVHAVNPVLLGSAGVLAANQLDRALVASYHTDVASYAAYYRLGWSIPVLWALLERAYGAAHVTLATSRAGSEQLAARGMGKAALWPRGVDRNQFRPNEPPRRRAPARRPVALYVGRLAHEKGLERLAPLTRPGSGIDLTVVGDGPARDELQRRFDGSATFTGALRGRALAEAYRAADVFVFPSTTDTLGLVLLEALASGLPVVAADSPATRETLAGCTASALFPPDDPQRLPAAVTELLDRAPVGDLARQAQAHTRQWDWHRSTSQLLRYYRLALLRAGTATDPAAPGHEQRTAA